MPWFRVAEVLLPFAWQKDCVISDEVWKAPEATSSRLSSPFNFLNISIPPLSQPLPTCHLCCWVNMLCLLHRSRGHRLWHLSCCWWWWGECYAWCVCVVLVQRWGGVAETEGPGLWAGAAGLLHFLASFTPLSYCWNPSQRTQSLSQTQTQNNDIYKHKKVTDTLVFLHNIHNIPHQFFDLEIKSVSADLGCRVDRCVFKCTVGVLVHAFD